ncbi:actin-like ATPase domain-containing protein [Neocallimastix californiae]|jgi:L1 cell adhesion molecule like protein|uniref:Actin-like ATPase domain-containing protein n=1 Tax=Neocallimastix californiae TaxID=1754190 RepID=A0A1Y2AGS6_9FUNG|nr:actin-like ATPase domain-containing protein [Neocallimastix californiae]|eukprot:ORY21490.1 actin-like ATPase domain-containing protein [Neocallimastix californiae]
MSKETCWIGISLGRDNAALSTTAVTDNVDIIANEDGDRLIPVCVSFGQQDFLIGTQAKNQLVFNSKNTIQQFIDIVGKSYDEIENKDAKLDEIDGKPVYNIEIYPPFDEETEEEVEPEIKQFSPEEISIKYLEALKKSAENFIGKDIEGCVVSVPISKIQNNDCNDLKEVIQKAGFKYVQTISEPAAAVLAYQDKDGEENTLCDKNILIADLGGRSFKSCLVKNSYGIITVLSQEECPVGGKDFDDILINYFKNEFKKKNHIDIEDNKRALTKLRLASEKTKRTLSRTNSTTCSVDSLAEGIDMHSTINKMRFDMLSNKLINQCLETIEDTVENSNIEFEDIDEVIIIGGASRMPKFQSKVESLFEEYTKIRNDIEPDEAIASGCAIQAKLLSENIDKAEYKKLLEDNEIKLPHLTQSLGIEDTNGDFIPIVPKNTVLPATRFLEVDNLNTPLYFAFYQGESEVAKENKLVSQVVIDDFVVEGGEAKEGEKINIRINLSSDSLVINAQNKSTKQSTKISIKL